MPDPRWYQQAVIYQAHVRTFADGNGDGIGDFRGLIGRLDYLARLGVTCLWLLPFYESPLRDDGYDISHYERIHPSYGTMADVEAFLSEAHRRGIRVIAELVINHTSDQHPWFQAARHAPAGGAKRDFYVWSQTNDRYAEARVIFSDAEESNWTWDPVAGAYYWHRFFHHQPDLNFDNPHVRQAVLKVMRFWFDKGVDGLRLDAIAHLYEREGTSCDNLPETHALLQWLRADLDARYDDRVLLAEANQPPDVLREYFGNGNECHMAFHFPLVARLFAAFADERAAPIVDIVTAAARIPESCQWALFLRNHDDLSLSALGPDENARLTQVYAPQARMQLHGGIRRRLAPMLGHDLRRIELAHALLCSLPGTPVIYYGDEIGMTDRLDLPDRDGLRTAMQWDASPSGGFSSATALRVPVNDDPTYGFRAINVESSWSRSGTGAAADVESLLTRIATILEARRQHPAFGSGGCSLLAADHPSMLLLIRSDGEERLLAAFNLSRDTRVTALPSDIEACDLVAAGRERPRIERASGHTNVTLPPYGWGWWRVTP
jgi:maltose alpha-D-glucosyltransferase/alpha-amylase